MPRTRARRISLKRSESAGASVCPRDAVVRLREDAVMDLGGAARDLGDGAKARRIVCVRAAVIVLEVEEHRAVTECEQMRGIDSVRR